jgi:hypothetical protein
VIELPPFDGADHINTTLVPEIDVDGASGLDGGYAARIDTSVEKALYPTEFLA